MHAVTYRYFLHLSDIEILETICKDCSTSKSNTQIPDNGGTNDEKAFNINAFSSNICKISCFSNINCSSSGLSFTCTTGDAPVYATSITVSGLVQDRLEFNDSFSNLKEININDCNLHILQITSNNTIQILTITNSLINIAEINDKSNSLRYVRFINCSFNEVNFFPNIEHTFEFFVHQSKVRNPRTPLNLAAFYADFSETRGFPFLIELFKHVIVNLSSCSLDSL